MTVPVTGGQSNDPAVAGDVHEPDEPVETAASNGERPSEGETEDEFGAPPAQNPFAADPDDPDLNPDVERASEIDDVTGPVPVVTPEAGASGEPAAGNGDADEPGGAGGDAQGQTDGGEVGEPEMVTAEELAAVCAERDEYKSMAQRIQADFDNFRRRSVAQTAAEVERAGGRLMEALLPALDAAEAAYVEHPDEVGPLLNAMLGELRKHGLETVELEGQPFDPEVAEAVAHEPGEGHDVIVAEVLRSGYRWKDKTLRPAMVRTRD